MIFKKFFVAGSLRIFTSLRVRFSYCVGFCVSLFCVLCAAPASAYLDPNAFDRVSITWPAGEVPDSTVDALAVHYIPAIFNPMYTDEFAKVLIYDSDQKFRSAFVVSDMADAVVFSDAIRQGAINSVNAIVPYRSNLEIVTEMENLWKTTEGDALERWVRAEDSSGISPMEGFYRRNVEKAFATESVRRSAALFPMFLDRADHFIALDVSTNADLVKRSAEAYRTRVLGEEKAKYRSALSAIVNGEYQVRTDAIDALVDASFVNIERGVEISHNREKEQAKQDIRDKISPQLPEKRLALWRELERYTISEVNLRLQADSLLAEGTADADLQTSIEGYKTRMQNLGYAEEQLTEKTTEVQGEIAEYADTLRLNVDSQISARIDEKKSEMIQELKGAFSLSLKKADEVAQKEVDALKQRFLSHARALTAAKTVDTASVGDDLLTNLRKQLRGGWSNHETQALADLQALFDEKARTEQEEKLGIISARAKSLLEKSQTALEGSLSLHNTEIFKIPVLAALDAKISEIETLVKGEIFSSMRTGFTKALADSEALLRQRFASIESNYAGELAPLIQAQFDEALRHEHERVRDRLPDVNSLVETQMQKGESPILEAVRKVVSENKTPLVQQLSGIANQVLVEMRSETDKTIESATAGLDLEINGLIVDRMDDSLIFRERARVRAALERPDFRMQDRAQAIRQHVDSTFTPKIAALRERTAGDDFQSSAGSLDARIQTLVEETKAWLKNKDVTFRGEMESLIQTKVQKALSQSQRDFSSKMSTLRSKSLDEWKGALAKFYSQEAHDPFAPTSSDASGGVAAGGYVLTKSGYSVRNADGAAEKKSLRLARKDGKAILDIDDSSVRLTRGDGVLALENRGAEGTVIRGGKGGRALLFIREQREDQSGVFVGQVAFTGDSKPYTATRMAYEEFKEKGILGSGAPEGAVAVVEQTYRDSAGVERSRYVYTKGMRFGGVAPALRANEMVNLEQMQVYVNSGVQNLSDQLVKIQSDLSALSSVVALSNVGGGKNAAIGVSWKVGKMSLEHFSMGASALLPGTRWTVKGAFSAGLKKVSAYNVGASYSW